MTISAIERMGVAPPVVPESEPSSTVSGLLVGVQSLRYTIKFKWGQIYLISVEEHGAASAGFHLDDRQLISDTLRIPSSRSNP